MPFLGLFYYLSLKLSSLEILHTLLNKTAFSLWGRYISFLLQRVGWEVGLLLSIGFCLLNLEDATTIGNMMSPYSGSPKQPLPASSPVSSEGSSQFAEWFGTQTGEVASDQERPGQQEATGAGPQEEGPATSAAAAGPSSRPQNPDPDLNLDTNLGEVTVTEELIEDLRFIDRRFFKLTGLTELISSKEDIEACQLEQKKIAELNEKTSLVLDSIRKREQDIQAAPEEEKARLRADPRTRELEASLQEILLDLGRPMKSLSGTTLSAKKGAAPIASNSPGRVEV